MQLLQPALARSVVSPPRRRLTLGREGAPTSRPMPEPHTPSPPLKSGQQARCMTRVPVRYPPNRPTETWTRPDESGNFATESSYRFTKS